MLANSAAAAGQALWHPTESIVGPDQELAHRMALLGKAARRRSAPAAAAAAHLRSDDLETDAVADRQLAAAGDARLLAGDVLSVTELSPSSARGSEINGTAALEGTPGTTAAGVRLFVGVQVGAATRLLPTNPL